MEFLELKDIAERHFEIVNPTTPEKLLAVGRALGLRPGMRVIDFGCGYGEMLALWADHFDIRGVGIDLRPAACDRAWRKMVARGLDDRIEIVCADGREYRFEHGAYDAATCIGATFIWGGFEAALAAMRPALRPGMRMAVGEVYWRTDPVPSAYGGAESFVREPELVAGARRAGFDLEQVLRASEDDWDRYESGNWVGLLRWIEENPDHPERGAVIAHLRESQDEYARFGRPYLGWAIYVLNPIRYAWAGEGEGRAS